MGLKRAILRVLHEEPRTVGFGGKLAADTRRALVLGAELALAPKKPPIEGLDLMVAGADEVPEQPSEQVPWGKRFRGDAGEDGGAQPDFVIVGLEGSSAIALRGEKPARVLELDALLPPEQLRAVNGLDLEAVIAPASLSKGNALSIADVLRLGFLSGSLRVPILVRTTATPEQAELEMLAIAGVAGVILAESNDVVQRVARVRAAIDAIDPKIRQRGPGNEPDRPIMLPFSASRAAESLDADSHGSREKTWKSTYDI
jgi:hypothetical protein